MLRPETVREIYRLLAEDRLSQGKIADLLGVSKQSVHFIAAGKRPDRDYRMRRAEDDDPDSPLLPPERCPGCGGLVLPPCRLCRVRAVIAKRANRQANRQRMRNRMAG